MKVKGGMVSVPLTLLKNNKIQYQKCILIMTKQSVVQKLTCLQCQMVMNVKPD